MGSDGGSFGTLNAFAQLYALGNTLDGAMDLEFVEELLFGSPINCGGGVELFVGISFRYGADMYVAVDGSLVAYASSRNVESRFFSEDDTVCLSQWVPR
jgi:hypothetical protein